MIQEFRVKGSHFEVGAAIGRHFAGQIHAAFDNYAFLREMQAYHQTASGQERYNKMLAIHQRAYPHYLRELEGIAAGAKRPLSDVLLVNLRGEYRGYIKESDDIRGCSDCSMLSDELALIGHNEDGAPAFRDHMHVIHAQVDDNPAFTACAYPGFLCGNAFGYNAKGICYAVDNLRPLNIRIGLGRQFLARALLDAASIADALARVSPDGRASGFSYTIGSIHERRIAQAEVMPDALCVTEIRGPHFHANHVQEIADADQTIDASSAERVARAEALLQSRRVMRENDVLEILGDEDCADYPIYRRAIAPDKSETYCTALFDLDAREMRIYHGHPVREPDQLTVYPMLAPR